jgi:hypothetical protein
MQKLMPLTKQIIIIVIGLIAVVTSAGWAFTDLDTKDALLVISPIVTGLFALIQSGTD